MPVNPQHFALRAWFAFKQLRLRTRPRPTDVPAIRSGDLAADRILVVGNGPSHGWGVLTHQLALTGQLAEAVAAQTGRACDADLVGAESMNVRSALAWIGDRDLSTIDAVVLVIGTNDALRLTELTTWEQELYDLLAGIEARVRPETVVTLAGIPPIAAFGAYKGTIARLTDKHRERLNAATRRIAAARRVGYVELPAPVASVDEAPVMAYRELAAILAAEVAPRIRAARPAATERPAQVDAVWDWSGAPAFVELARTGGDSNLRRLTEQAQKSFGVELAVVSLVEGDRLYHGTNTDVVPASVPLELSFCRYTVESGEPVIIPDTGKDPRFEDNPLVDVSFINFYAGYPLRATDGHVIGSFCLQGSQARRESTIALDLLRQLALEAEEVLRGYEVETPVRGPVQVVMPQPTGPAITF
ncbi:MAG: GAF domain-containing protein [Microbacteriaceae bacterium]